MGRDAILLIVILAVVIGGGAAFWLFWSGSEESTLGQKTVVEEQNEPAAVTPRRNAGVSSIDVESQSNLPPQPTEPEAVATAEDPATAAEIHGTVRGPDGAGIGGAVVALLLDVSDHPTFSLQGDVVAQALSDDAGRYRITNISTEDRYVVRFEHEHFASRVVPQISLNPGEKRDVSAQLAPGLSIIGTVTDQDGNPVAGAEILVYDQQNRAMDPERNVERVAVTDGNGGFEVTNLNPGHKRVTARADGHATVTKNSVVVEQGKPIPTVDFTLGAGAAIAGVVVDQDGPVEGVLINAQPVRQGNRNIVLNNYPPVKSDAEGRFQINGLLSGPYTLICHKKGYPPRGTRVNARTGQLDVKVQMRRNPVIRGRVIDEATGDPIKHFTIIMSRDEYLVYSTNRMSDRFTDEEGKFEFTSDIDSGEVYLFALAKGYAGGRSNRISLPSQGDVEGVVIPMYKGATVKGRIVNSDGAGVGGARVELIPESAAMQGEGLGFLKALINNSMRTVKKSTRTDAEGNYVFEQVHEGHFVIAASHKDYAKTRMENTVLVGRQGETRFPDVVLMRGGTITGIVRDSEGQPEGGSKVQLSPKGQLGGGSGYSAITDSRGRFKITHIQPGLYMVEVVERGGKPVDPFQRLFNRQGKVQEVLIGDGDEIEVELD